MNPVRTGICLVVVAVGICTVALGATSGVVEADGGGPLAEAGLDQTTTQGSTVHLDAGGSTAPGGTIEHYEWEITTPEGTTIQPECASCVNTSFVPEEPGTYEVTVTVTDDEKRTDSDTLYVEVEPYEPPEVTVQGPESVPADEKQTFTVDAEATEEPLTALLWRLNGEHHEDSSIEEEMSVSENANVTFNETGIHQLNVTVGDEAGHHAGDGLTVEVKEPALFAVEIEDITEFGVDDENDAVVTATVENTGGIAATQPINLTHDQSSEVADSKEITLDAGESTELELAWSGAADALTDGNPADGFSYTTAEVTVASPGDSTSTSVTPETAEELDTDDGTSNTAYGVFDAEVNVQETNVEPGDDATATVSVFWERPRLIPDDSAHPESCQSGVPTGAPYTRFREDVATCVSEEPAEIHTISPADHDISLSTSDDRGGDVDSSGEVDIGPGTSTEATVSVNLRRSIGTNHSEREYSAAMFEESRPIDSAFYHMLRVGPGVSTSIDVSLPKIEEIEEDTPGGHGDEPSNGDDNDDDEPSNGDNSDDDGNNSGSGGVGVQPPGCSHPMGCVTVGLTSPLTEAVWLGAGVGVGVRQSGHSGVDSRERHTTFRPETGPVTSQALPHNESGTAID